MSASSKKPALTALVSRLRKHWPRPRCELNFETPLQLMIGTILSAQSTDKRVNEISPALFKKYPTVRAFAAASPLDLEKEIHSTGFFRSKTKSILGACRTLVEKFNGEMPKTMEELLELPGIGRKSANVILGAAFGISSGVVVDTHMTRLAHRLGLSKEEDPEKIERDLNALVPVKDRIYFSQSMVLHGRYICLARTPRCFECFLADVCPYPDKLLKRPAGEPEGDRKTITDFPILVRK